MSAESVSLNGEQSTNWTNNSGPLVSVIIPVYNGERFLEQTVNSVLAQTYQNFEILIVDDGSTDRSVDIATSIASRDDRISIHQQRNRGVAAARNYAIHRARGEYIAPLDADDIWYQEKLERQVACMQESGENVGLVYCSWVGINERGDVLGQAKHWGVVGDVFARLLYTNFVGNASVPLIRRTSIEEVGAYSTRLRALDGEGCEDWDLYLRIAAEYDFAEVNARLVGYRSVATSMSANSVSMARSHSLILDEIAENYPDIAPSILAWSRGKFYQYLASRSYNVRRPGRAIKWIHKSIYSDPASILSSGLIKLYGKSILRFFAQPVTKTLWPDLESWIQFRQKYSFRKKWLYPIQASYEERKGSWDWKPWKPYDRICLARWERLTHYSINSRQRTPISKKTSVATDLHAGQ